MRPVRRTSMICCVGLLATLSFSGCRDEERNRPAAHEPGVYSGDKLPSLTAAKQRELADRANLMR
jgi:hypothetical protein